MSAADSPRKWVIAAILVASIASAAALYVASSSSSSRPAGKPASPKAPSSSSSSATAATAKASTTTTTSTTSTTSTTNASTADDAKPAKRDIPAPAAPVPVVAAVTVAVVADASPKKPVAAAVPPESPTRTEAAHIPAPESPVAAAAAAAPAPADLKASLNPKQKEELAQQLKNQGNELYKATKFEEAITYYSQAIELQPSSAVFWCNRAACYANLNDSPKVIDDCTKALELDPTYVKALHRRAIAFELQGRMRDALNDFTTMTILDGYKNPNAMAAAERLVKGIAETKANELLPTRKPMLPSFTFVQAYLEAFRPVIPSAAAEDATPEANLAAAHLQAALRECKDRDYDAADRSVAAAVAVVEDQEQTTEKAVAAFVWNMQGTFSFLKGQVDAAAESLEKSLLIDGTHINTMIKCSNILMEKGDAQATLATFEKALQITETDPDVFYHRGQVKFLLNDFAGACLDYQKSIDLDPKFPPAYIQLGVSQYKLGSIQTAMGTFKTAMSMFPSTSDVYNYFAELLQDQGRFQEAVEYYDKSIAMSPNQPMAYINKAMLMFQVFQDAPAAESLLRTALAKDPKCDLVYIQLANFLLPHGKVDEAVAYFDKAVELARTQPELVNVLIAKESVLAQYHVTQVLPASVIAEGFK
ncbi:hypothetical protein BC828DRAFT_409729 [Blastocladiella britannica]|nr:hypothetical protein BC828DRAFT_409729 [Blastocladiella britannica]